MRVIDMNDIISSMRNQTQFVMHCEEVYHDKISSACGAILENLSQKPFVALTGPSGSGKTTTAMRIQAYLNNSGAKVCMLSMDNFFLALDQRPVEARTDWESPHCVDWEQLVDVIDGLSQGKTVQAPVYDFVANRPGGFVPMEGSKEAVILVEGIHMLNPIIFDSIRSRATGLYVAPRTRIITPDDHIVKPEEVRVARRMIRDYLGRGKSLRATIDRAKNVDLGEMKYIAPNKCNASIHIDTFHDYELCYLAGCIRTIPEFAELENDGFAQERGLGVLMDVVRQLPPLTTPYIPKDSLTREFVGGSCFKY